MKLLVLVLVVFGVVVDGRWPFDQLHEVFQEMFAPAFESWSASTRVVPMVKQSDDVLEGQKKRQTVVCQGVGTRIPTENVCQAQDCRATSFLCPGINGTVAVPVRGQKIAFFFFFFFFFL